jgi:hypothetical protein
MKLGAARITREHIYDATETACRHLADAPAHGGEVAALLAELDWIDVCGALERAARRLNDRAAGRTR